MLTSEERRFLEQCVTIDGDGNVVGKDNTVQITRVTADTYTVQKDQRQITVTMQDLRRVFNIERSQIGVVGDHATIYGGINFYQHAAPRRADAATLAAAQKKLADMPTDELPAHASLPHGSRMPLAHNNLFVGREQDLQALAQALKGGQTTAIGQIAAATGLGGIGKTQLASEFVHRYGQYFAGGVFWLSFADPAGIRAEIATCGGPSALDLPNFAALSFEDQVRRVLSAWQSPLPRLLVFDNCEAEALLAQWRPPTGGARVLVTSRCGTWNPALGVETLRLDVLPRPESVALLRKHRPDLSVVDAEAIADELGDLPLALHLAGHFLAVYQHTSFGAPADYLKRLRAEGLDHPSLVESGETLPTAHARHVGRTFALSYERLDSQEPTDTLALDLLARAAYFAPGEIIPRALLLATLDLPEDDDAVERQAADALARLIGLGLLDEEKTGALLVHRLLAAFARQTTTEDAAQMAVEEALLAEANRLNNAGFPEPLLAWQPHLYAVTNVALAREDERAAALCNTLGYHLDMIGDYAAARPYLERALAIWEEVLGPQHPDTALSLNNLSLLCCYEGKLEEAADFMRKALTIWRELLGPNHPHTQKAWQSLAAIEEQSQQD
jgi:tetratricopeptide (TPR) repeat protein